MKKALVFVMLAVLFVGGSCSAQQGGGNLEKGIIGTWTDYDGDTWGVFSADGKLTRNGNPYKFGVAGDKLAITRILDNGKSSFNEFYSASISSDGKTLILMCTSGCGSEHYWLTKK